MLELQIFCAVVVGQSLRRRAARRAGLMAVWKRAVMRAQRIHRMPDSASGDNRIRVQMVDFRQERRFPPDHYVAPRMILALGQAGRQAGRQAPHAASVAVPGAGHFSLASSSNSEDDSFSPHAGHLPLFEAIVSLRDFSIFMFVIFSPHLPHTTFTDMIRRLGGAK